MTDIFRRHQTAGPNVGQLRGEQFERLFRNAYASATTTISRETLFRAALASVVPPVALSHQSAALIHGMPLPRLDDGLDPVHVTSMSRARHQLGLCVHSGYDAVDVMFVGDIALTRPVRTWIDLAAALKLSALTAIADDIIRREQATREELDAAIEAHPGRRGIRLARLALTHADGIAESAWETYVRLILHGAGILVEAQVEVYDSRGNFVARLDFALRKLKIAVEYDGSQHAAPDQQRSDLRRIQRLQRAGWIVLRYTAEDVATPSRIIDDVRRAIADRM
jgi:very-short-patch-repair endonuclease